MCKSESAEQIGRYFFISITDRCICSCISTKLMDKKKIVFDHVLFLSIIFTIYPGGYFNYDKKSTYLKHTLYKLVNYWLLYRTNTDFKSNLPISFLLCPLSTTWGHYGLGIWKDTSLPSKDLFTFFQKNHQYGIHLYKHNHTLTHIWTYTYIENKQNILRKIILIVLFWHRKLMNDYKHDFDFHSKLILIWAHIFEVPRIIRSTLP